MSALEINLQIFVPNDAAWGFLGLVSMDYSRHLLLQSRNVPQYNS